MADQGVPSLMSTPAPPDTERSNPGKPVVLLLNLMSGPILLCERIVIPSLQVLRSLAPAIWKPRKVRILPMRAIRN